MRLLKASRKPLNRDIRGRWLTFRDDKLFPDDPPNYDPLDDELAAPWNPDDPWNNIYGQLTPSQKAQLVDEYPAGVLGLRLWASKAFRQRVETVRAHQLDPDVAHAEAGAWIKRGLGRKTIAWYLIEAAKAPHYRERLRVMGGAGRRMIPVDTPLQPGQPQRRKLNVRLTERGVDLLVRRGDGICFGAGCNVRLSEKPSRAASGRRIRVDYCSVCQRSSDLAAESDAKAIKFVLDSAAAVLVPNAPDRRRERRRRRGSAP